MLCLKEANHVVNATVNNEPFNGIVNAMNLYLLCALQEIEGSNLFTN